MPLYSPSGHAMRYLYIVQRSFAHSTPGMTSISTYLTPISVEWGSVVCILQYILTC